jgi:hypothetical protein
LSSAAATELSTPPDMATAIALMKAPSCSRVQRRG